MQFKVFASRYLEVPSKDNIIQQNWTWTPANSEIKELYASGASTTTQQSTYAAEKDDRGDSDRPNEGLLIV
jgi:hypothetical protein